MCRIRNIALNTLQIEQIYVAEWVLGNDSNNFISFDLIPK